MNKRIFPLSLALGALCLATLTPHKAEAIQLDSQTICRLGGAVAGMTMLAAYNIMPQKQVKVFMRSEAVARHPNQRLLADEMLVVQAGDSVDETREIDFLIRAGQKFKSLYKSTLIGICAGATSVAAARFLI